MESVSPSRPHEEGAARIAALIEEAMAAHGLDVEQLAVAADVPLEDVSRILEGGLTIAEVLALNGQELS